MRVDEPTVRIRLVGDELRRYREALRLTLDQVADLIGISKGKLSKMETGNYSQKCEEVAGLLAIYGVKGAERKELLDLTREAHESGLWHRNSHLARVATLGALESRAIGLINFECTVIPGLLQTVPYIQGLMRNAGMINDEEIVGERVAARVHRQAILRKAGAPDFQAIIAESALHNMVGDVTVMREQLVYLTEAAQRPNVSVRIIPASVGNHPGLDGPFLRMRFHDRHGVVVLGNRTSCLYFEDDDTLMSYSHVLVELLSVALSNEESIALVRAIEGRLAEEQLQRI